MSQAQPIFQKSIKLTTPLFCPKCSSKNVGKNGKNSSGSQSYICKQCKKIFTPVVKEEVERVVNPKLEYLKDIWDCRCLGIDGGVGKSSYKLNFTHLFQPRLRKTAKAYLKVCLSSITFASVQEKLYSLRRLSSFLTSDYPRIEPEDIDRKVITDFTIHLASLKLASSTRYKILSDTRLFFDAAYQNKWLNVSRYLVRPEDFPKQEKSVPR